VKWSYPSRSDCLACHTTAAGFVLGVNTRQLNGPFTDPATGVTENQLRAWGPRGVVAAAADGGGGARSPPPVAARGPVWPPAQRRGRSYRDANCAQCHRPGGARGEFDARFDTPPGRQKLIGGALIAADLGVPGAKVVVPGSPEKSMLYLRMNRRQDVFNMPPLATNLVDPDAVAAVAEWIKSLPRTRAR